MNKHHVTTALVAGVTLGLTLTGCGSDNAASGSDSKSSDIRLAGVLANTSDPFWSSVACGAQDQAKKRGVTLKMFTSTSTDNNAIANNWQSASLSNPDGVLATPFNNNQFIAQYKTLMQKGVPVVTGNPSQPQAEYKSVTSDTDTAQFVSDALKNVADGAGTMVYMGGAPGIPPLENRTKPFVDAVASARPDLKRLDNEFSGFDINKATTDASSLIIAHPDLKLIIAADGPDAVGAAAAIQQAKKVGDIALIGFDAVPPEVDALKKGTISALIAQAPFKIGATQVDALVDYLKGGSKGPVTSKGLVKVGNKLLTADNVDDPANADYVYKASC